MYISLIRILQAFPKKSYLRISEGHYIYQEMSQKIKLSVNKSLLNAN